ncbi:ferritin-like domain-containing protein [Burkholderia perseverans]|uniref:ferritin-like domain-containing protein n=1 Tax=Burkholderia perseverans TaxID=2615214 RepID=UPI001FED49E0|nr:ferritin-like domain-containing protein [Burkholderia perseverans]
MAGNENSTDKHLDDWLRDAHAMEQQAETMLNAMAKRLEHYPDLKQRIEQHILETQEQSRLVRECLERRGSDTSSMKDLTAKSAAAMQGFFGMFSPDEVVKGGIAGYVFEHFEIASYRALIAAARDAGDAQTAAVCERILPEEIAMAQWLEAHLPAVTDAYLARSRADVEAKR